ncbi:MAG TPA: NAD(P)H-dependent oxidoreductase [Dissulfurispiraceae bacterium]|nr:NAD(P)H-dependent oxidoreductase [Dissulfurispiraceae bacterium]
MKIVAFQGSPRPSGNTEILLEEALKPVKKAGHEVVLFKLNYMRIKPCQDCGSCEKSGQCIINDDMGEIYDAIRSADRIILASPIFFFALSAQVKAMIDRCQAFWCEKYLLKRSIAAGPHGRKGLLLLVGGMKKEIGATCSDATATAFFRTVSVPKHEVVSALGVDAKGAALEHPEALKDALEAGKRLVA